MKRNKERRLKKLRKQNLKDKGKKAIESWNEVRIDLAVDRP